MKHLVGINSVLILIMFNISCGKDFLNSVNDGQQLLRHEYVIDINTTKEYLNGVYVTIANELYNGSYNYAYADVIADDIKPRTGWSGVTPMISLYNWTQQADETQTGISETSLNCNGFSYTCYRLIRACNFTIESADKYKDGNSALSASLKGQALAIRAFLNHLLLNYFSQPYNFTDDASHPGIVWITSSEWNGPTGNRLSVRECYDKLIQDLILALDLLNSDQISQFTFNRSSVTALLARVFLWKGDYENAKMWSLESMSYTPLMLVGYPEKLFGPEDRETILQIKPSEYSTNNYSTYFPSVSFRDIFEFEATSDIADLLTTDSNDKRSSWVTKLPDGIMITKYPSNVVPGISLPSTAYYQPILRSSELCLTAAEALAKMNNDDSAIYYLDKIKLRANEHSLKTTARGNELLQLIYQERRKELCFEGLRMFDLLRRGEGVNRTDALSGSPRSLSYPNNKAIAPIPRLDVTSLKIPQNSDY